MSVYLEPPIFKNLRKKIRPAPHIIPTPHLRLLWISEVSPSAICTPIYAKNYYVNPFMFEALIEELQCSVRNYSARNCPY